MRKGAGYGPLLDGQRDVRRRRRFKAIRRYGDPGRLTPNDGLDALDRLVELELERSGHHRKRKIEGHVDGNRQEESPPPCHAPYSTRAAAATTSSPPATAPAICARSRSYRVTDLGALQPAVRLKL